MVRCSAVLIALIHHIQSSGADYKPSYLVDFLRAVFVGAWHCTIDIHSLAVFPWKINRTNKIFFPVTTTEPKNPFLYLETLIMLITNNNKRSYQYDKMHLSWCGKQTAEMSVINLWQSESVDRTWWSHCWQHAKVIVICGNVPQFQKCSPDPRLRVTQRVENGTIQFHRQRFGSYKNNKNLCHRTHFTGSKYTWMHLCPTTGVV